MDSQEQPRLSPLAEWATALATFGRRQALGGGPRPAVTTAADALAAFNGYYALDGAPGAFFAIDANVHVVAQPYSQTLSIDLLFCLDGKTSYSVPFDGQFDGIRLTQQFGGLTLDLTFSRPACGFGPTARVSGGLVYQISEWNRVTLPMSGTTYNNPIPMSLFAGDYYQPGTNGAPPLAVAKISVDSGGQVAIAYDWGQGKGLLLPVAEFTYNCNMYYYTLADASHPLGPTSPRLIMGTAVGQGFACNDIDLAAVTLSRLLYTIPASTAPTPPATSPPNAEDLAAFSGYYPLDAIAPGAFLSIGGQYLTGSGQIGYQVAIGYSFDGQSSTSFFFDSSMTFDPASGVLTTPDLTVTFTRGYDPATSTLASVTGVVGGQTAAGRTPFNPVPLSAFGPAQLTNTSGPTSVQVTSDTSVLFVDSGGTEYVLTEFICVPLMYIVGSTVNGQELILSFGTDGPRGIACIVTLGTAVSSVWALPNAG
jgi:hypothetical protein